MNVSSLEERTPAESVRNLHPVRQDGSVAFAVSGYRGEDHFELTRDLGLRVKGRTHGRGGRSMGI
jgi:hypothetical protein